MIKVEKLNDIDCQINTRSLQKIKIESKKNKKTFFEITRRLTDIADFYEGKTNSSSNSSIRWKNKRKKRLSVCNKSKDPATFKFLRYLWRIDF